MAITLGSFTFDTLESEIVPPNGLVLEDITRPGVEGAAFRVIGQRGRPFRARTRVTVAYDSTTVYNLLVAYRDAIGNTFQLVDPVGITWDNCLVLECMIANPVRVTKILKGAGVTQDNGYMIQVDWLWQLT